MVSSIVLLLNILGHDLVTVSYFLILRGSLVVEVYSKIYTQQLCYSVLNKLLKHPCYLLTKLIVQRDNTFWIGFMSGNQIFKLLTHKKVW